MIQTATINGWHPQTNPNKRSAHWSGTRKKHLDDRDTTCGALCFAKWKPVAGRARLLIELVYPVNRLPDRDNCYSRIKGVLDSIKPHEHYVAKLGIHVPCPGFIRDDSDRWLDLTVVPVYEKGTKAVRFTLEEIG
jgi:hypothetical protein